ncbi:MAG: hypothetical protein HC892_09550 [Saprospiraceae bacterium]|nr:hypothetical protein [Saprospiraceae bacterium]
MKTIYFIRHAKSDWEHLDLADIDRPLNDRGFRDAPRMAAFLKEKKITPSAIVSSPANRAHMTANFFADAFGIDREKIIIQSKIYLASSITLLELILTFPDTWETILLFGHNPSMTELANLFGKERIDNVPTCGIVCVESRVKKWKDFSQTTASRRAVYFPKNLS